MSRKRSLIQILLGATASILALSICAQDTDSWKPTPQQANALGDLCKGWRQIAAGVYMLKLKGVSKPAPNNQLHAKIIDEVYAENSSVASPEMAASMGEQFCIPITKDDFRSGRLSISKSGAIIKH